MNHADLPNVDVSGHYVYLYRDHNTEPCYVGYGETPERASSPDHSDELREFVNAQNYTLEIAGPFGSEEAGRAVETALFSAISPKFNVAQGTPQHRFRTLGVPLMFADRLNDPPLDKEDLLKLRLEDKAACPILLVYIGRQSLYDQLGAERPGYNPADPLQDRQLLERMERWWQLAPHYEKWRTDESSSPAILLALTGNPYARMIIGSIKVDRSAWGRTESDGSFYSVPHGITGDPRPGQLDACALRGRRIRATSNLKFGNIPSQQYIFLHCNGKVDGGSSAK